MNKNSHKNYLQHFAAMACMLTCFASYLLSGCGASDLLTGKTAEANVLPGRSDRPGVPVLTHLGSRRSIRMKQRKTAFTIILHRKTERPQTLLMRRSSFLL